MKIWGLLALLTLVAACGDTATTTAPPSTAATTTLDTTAATTTPVTTAPATTTPVTTAPATTAATTTAPITTIDPDAPIVVDIDFSAGQASGPGRLEVNKGDKIEIVLTSDVTDELHVHGYDLFADVTAGESVSIAFEATIQGIFEVELERARAPLLELVVN
jgi:hypothetical protein